jgi:hypothetical protein
VELTEPKKTVIGNHRNQRLGKKCAPLQDFLSDIRQGQSVDFNSLANVLCQRAEGSNPMVQLTCMIWLKELVALAKSELKAQYADILAAVLPTLSHSKPEIQEVSLPQRYCYTL